jgi:hypothetical protein
MTSPLLAKAGGAHQILDGLEFAWDRAVRDAREDLKDKIRKMVIRILHPHGFPLYDLGDNGVSAALRWLRSEHK